MKHKIEGSQWRAKQEKVSAKVRLAVTKFFSKKREEPKPSSKLVFRPKRRGHV